MYIQVWHMADLISLGLDLFGHFTVAQNSLHKLEESSPSLTDLPHSCIVSVHLVHHVIHLPHLKILACRE